MPRCRPSQFDVAVLGAACGEDDGVFREGPGEVLVVGAAPVAPSQPPMTTNFLMAPDLTAETISVRQGQDWLCAKPPTMVPVSAPGGLTALACAMRAEKSFFRRPSVAIWEQPGKPAAPWSEPVL
jgi:hypothetical protein